MPARIKHVTAGSGTAGVTLTPLGHAAGDYLVVTCESSGSTTAAGTPGTPTGFTKVFERTEGAGATGVTTLTIFIKLSDGTETSIAIGTAGNHLSASLEIVQGADPTIGNIVVGTGNGGNSGTATLLGLTTPTDDCLVGWFMSTTNDANATNFTAYSNGNLGGIDELYDISVASGAGGGIAVGSSFKATAGSTGNGTATHTPGNQWNAVYIAFPIKPVTTFPVEYSVAITNSTASTTLPVTLASGAAVGDTLMIVARFNNPGAVTSPSGWTNLVAYSPLDVTEQDDAWIVICWRKADGSEGATADFSNAVSTKYVAIAVVLKNADDPATSPPQVNTGVGPGIGVTSTAPNPASLTPSGGSKDYLWYNIATGQGTPTMPPSPPSPSNYGMITALGSAGGGAASNNWIAIASRQLTASSEDPGAWTLDTAQTWTAWTVAVYPVVSAPPAPGPPLRALRRRLHRFCTLR